MKINIFIVPGTRIIIWSDQNEPKQLFKVDSNKANYIWDSVILPNIKTMKHSVKLREIKCVCEIFSPAELRALNDYSELMDNTTNGNSHS